MGQSGVGVVPALSSDCESICAALGSQTARPNLDRIPSRFWPKTLPMLHVNSASPRCTTLGTSMGGFIGQALALAEPDAVSEFDFVSYELPYEYP